MIVFRAFGNEDFRSRAPDGWEEREANIAFNRMLWEAEAIFVAPDELHAVGWGLCLTGKHSIECLEVARIRNRNTLDVVAEFTPTIVHLTLSGKGERFRELCLYEAVVLEEDIVARYRVTG
jgi:hypothetical protein